MPRVTTKYRATWGTIARLRRSHLSSCNHLSHSLSASSRSLWLSLAFSLSLFLSLAVTRARARSLTNTIPHSLPPHPPTSPLPNLYRMCALSASSHPVTVYAFSDAEQQTISTAGCFGMDLTCGCCQQPSNLARVDHSNLQKIDTNSCFRRQEGLSAVAHGIEKGMKLKKQISVDPVVTEEDEGATLAEINETGNAMQVLP